MVWHSHCVYRGGVCLVGFDMYKRYCGPLFYPVGGEADAYKQDVALSSGVLLGAGIFIGAVWANESWGRYWAWDPKEVWALITFMVYGLAFHTDSFPVFRRPRFFHIYVVLALLTVLMTYFGVNHWLGGLHSYN